ncbi:MAG TPA: RidA family protein [Actinomycetota bacterium]|jgi:enamine deaminase RidA (YjgF/YER057c/UK114 family)|nr:RidA family protein [Actinomycetota bacterium]
MSVEERLAELGLELPPAPKPVASYVPVATDDGVAYVAGQIPMEEGKPLATGRVGEDLSVEEAHALARRCALQALGALKEELGSLDRVRRVIKVTVWVASSETFTEHPQVANGASDLLVEVFGEAGKHARAAVGTPSLPLGAPVEVEMIVAIG